MDSKQSLTARQAAAQVLTVVARQHQSLNSVLANTLNKLPETERSLCQQLCYGVIRWYPTLDFISQQLLKKPFKSKDTDLQVLLMIGLYQLRDMRTPSHAAISETVNSVKKTGKQWAAGVINACLRNYQRRSEAIESAAKDNLTARMAHPDWLIEQYRQDWPDKWQQILDANNQQPPMMLRVNALRSSRTDYLATLQQADIPAEPLEQTQSGIILQQAQNVFSLPGFTEGVVSVQDGAAQLATEIMALQPGLHILDACAAPGGKTCHILELAPDSAVTAIDIEASRLSQIQENTDRLQLKASLIEADAADTDAWWNGKLFDRILIDAPCTGSGVIRRHPDIKLLRQPTDIAQLAKKQQQLLNQLWPLLKAGGMMVYTTCSVFKQENEQQIERFLREHQDAQEYRYEHPPATPTTHGYQRLPGDDEMDGFFYACIQRV